MLTTLGITSQGGILLCHVCKNANLGPHFLAVRAEGLRWRRLRGPREFSSYDCIGDVGVFWSMVIKVNFVKEFIRAASGCIRMYSEHRA